MKNTIKVICRREIETSGGGGTSACKGEGSECNLK